MKFNLRIIFFVVIFIFGNRMTFAGSVSCKDEVSGKAQFISLSDEVGVLPEKNIWTEYGKVFDEFLGVQALANLPYGKGGQYQCTELVHRFLREKLGVPTKIGLGLGHAKDLLQNLESRFESSFSIKENPSKKVNLKFLRSGCAKISPTLGSLISFKAGQFGHVAIIRKVEVLSNNSLKLYLFEQHGELKFLVGQSKPVRSVTAHKNSSGYWSVPESIGWIVYQSD